MSWCPPPPPKAGHLNPSPFKPSRQRGPVDEPLLEMTHVSVPVRHSAPPGGKGKRQVAESLDTLARLAANGIITQEQFEACKSNARSMDWVRLDQNMTQFQQMPHIAMDLDAKQMLVETVKGEIEGVVAAHEQTITMVREKAEFNVGKLEVLQYQAKEKGDELKAEMERERAREAELNKYEHGSDDEEEEEE
eukprot:CAMPEP_0114150846 /NCGR_PEP_ID=MMETSP0043_2-20121206/22939_1 /TAXON_ID=464988 /ORGANISM="Hemiselmis andersenii, Strain CCMP644" /LENGTH=191 /DNA_ID=CAMNT_0001245641 /DNA_START=1 /DNA_END=573 /DNA_ORIENTATION=+